MCSILFSSLALSAAATVRHSELQERHMRAFVHFVPEVECGFVLVGVEAREPFTELLIVLALRCRSAAQERVDHVNRAFGFLKD